MTTPSPAPRSVRCLVVGAGPAGYTAAIYAARALLNPVLLTGLTPGGQLTITTDVENYPGFAEVIQGPWLMDQMRDQAAHVGTEVIDDLVVSADLSTRPFRLTADSGQVWLAETLIIATGAQAKWLGLPSEKALQGFGVSACATCDGFFYRGKDVVVVGGGNTAVEEALFLTKFASKVTLVHRRDELRAEKILQERLFAHERIEVIWDHGVDEVLSAGDPATVTGVRLRGVNTGETTDLACDGLFIAIGHAPASEVFAGQLETRAGGYLTVTAGSTATSITGVFAAGDVTDDVFRQAVTAAGMGCMAALEAVRLLAEEDHARAHHPLSHHEAEKIGGLVIVKSAAPADAAAIRALVSAAFGRPNEADMIAAVRSEGKALAELVAVSDGAIAGHVHFNRMTCDLELFVAGLAPLAVAPESQGKGIGAALVRQGLEACRALGAQACVVLGAPAYYGRFGFSAAPRTLASPYAGLAAFQALEFAPGVLARPIAIAYPSAFG